MRKTLLLGMGMGALAMYYLDPSWGRRRRAQLRDWLDSGARRMEELHERSEAARVFERSSDGLPSEDADIDWTTGYTH
ncbi:MAG: hypothetical protein ACREKM_07545, partial [Longimicrobiales bacterium]